MIENDNFVLDTVKETTEDTKLSLLLRAKVKGAIVRSCFISLKDMDTPSAFFCNLEKSVSQCKLMTCLRLPDNTITTNRSELQLYDVEFYSGLYRKENCEQQLYFWKVCHV